MIYPVPDPRFPFLGVHFTRGVYDNVHVGPNAVPALAREGYKWLKISLKDTWESLRWPGAWPLAKQHWRMGVDEISGSLIKPLYFRKARRFVPELKMSDLAHKTAAGVRAQAWGARRRAAGRLRGRPGRAGHTAAQRALSRRDLVDRDRRATSSSTTCRLRHRRTAGRRMPRRRSPRLGAPPTDPRRRGPWFA